MGIETLAIGLGIAALTAGAVVGTQAATGTGMFEKSAETPAAAPVPLPPAPTPSTALADAQTQADERRRTILATGGATNPTGAGGAILNPTQVSGKTLLGS